MLTKIDQRSVIFTGFPFYFDTVLLLSLVVQFLVGSQNWIAIEAVFPEYLFCTE